MSLAVRRRLLLAWAAGAVLGLVLILFSQQPTGLRVALGAAWMAVSIVEFAARAGFRVPYARLRIRADGTAVGLRPDGRDDLELLRGSVVVDRAAWLRFRSRRTGQFSVLILSPDLGPVGWRRLNLLWQHGLKR